MRARRLYEIRKGFVCVGVGGTFVCGCVCWGGVWASSKRGYLCVKVDELLITCWKAFLESTTPHQQHWAGSIQTSPSNHLSVIGQQHPYALMLNRRFFWNTEKGWCWGSSWNVSYYSVWAIAIYLASPLHLLQPSSKHACTGKHTCTCKDLNCESIGTSLSILPPFQVNTYLCVPAVLLIKFNIIAVKQHDICLGPILCANSYCTIFQIGNIEVYNSWLLHILNASNRPARLIQSTYSNSAFPNPPKFYQLLL